MFIVTHYLLPLALFVLVGCGVSDSQASGSPSNPELASALAAESATPGLPALAIAHPLDNAVYPPDLAAPLFAWDAGNADHWLVSVLFSGNAPAMHLLLDESSWVPDRDSWEAVKTACQAGPATLVVTAFVGESAISSGRAQFFVAAEPIGDTVIFREVGPELSTHPRVYSSLRWRLADLASYAEPPVIMSDLDTCGSCHSVSPDGQFFSMEMDWQGDKGAQIVTRVRPDMRLGEDDFVSWSNMLRPSEYERVLGLFGKLSPDSRYLVATVHERFLAVRTNEQEFSQLFLTTKGKLGVLDSVTGFYSLLLGADIEDVIQTDPVFSPDGSEVLFARAAVVPEILKAVADGLVVNDRETIHELNAKYPLHYDIWRVPFNDGAGGKAEPVLGAGDNGRSNYFPRISPDRRWLVYTSSASGLMLQPDAELWIVPSQGGVPRRMNLNLSPMSSWHSWSSNGHWLLFASKAESLYTRAYLSYIDDKGFSSPPVLLHRLGEADAAVNVPELVPLAPGAIHRIQLPLYD